VVFDKRKVTRLFQQNRLLCFAPEQNRKQSKIKRKSKLLICWDTQPSNHQSKVGRQDLADSYNSWIESMWKQQLFSEPKTRFCEVISTSKLLSESLGELIDFN